MSKKTVLVVGKDKISKNALYKIKKPSSVIVVEDASKSLKRLAKLIYRKKMSLSLLLRMVYCELKRYNYGPTDNDQVVSSNPSLLKVIKEVNPDKVILFRAGLIINQELLETGVPFLNIHCAKVPEFGGLGSISKALKEKAYQQAATFHRVTEFIDRGEILDVEPYELDPELSYCANENKAYEAGAKLLERQLFRNYTFL